MLKSSLERYLDTLKNAEGFAENIPFWSRKPKNPAQLVGFPQDLDNRVADLLTLKGIRSLYSHQAQAIEHLHRGDNVVVSTGTASGKSLCYMIPILEQMVQNESATALLFFPTKALENDQLNSFAEFRQLANPEIGQTIISAVYDGDTPSHLRSAIRDGARIILTNPDMLHLGILPHHTTWMNFLRNLKYVVIDEVHIYRGVFGSNVANVIRRLDRILSFYGAKPQYILTSATISNPKEHAERLIGRTVESISEDGSPHGERNFVFYNPPIVNEELGVRKGLLSTTIDFSTEILSRNIQTLLFMRSRRGVELAIHDLRELYPRKNHQVRGYRSGYLKADRREIEHGLKAGEITLAVATNALELGVDIGGVDQVIMAGYPGTITSTLQQAGRAGRKLNESVAVLIASANPLDQFLCQHPDYILERSPERALIDPDNPLILIQQLVCAQFELPFLKGDTFGNILWDDLEQYLKVLADQGTLIKRGERYFYSSEEYPASLISLRSTATRSINLQVEEDGKPRLIGEVDYASSLWMTHPGAVYLHEGETYLVKDLDLEENVAHLQEQLTPYFTEPVKTEEIQLVNDQETLTQTGCEAHYGEITVTSKIDSFKKIDWETRTVINVEPLDLPPTVLQTMGYWIILNDETVEKMREEKMWASDPNDYGPNWDAIRQKVRERDSFRCRMCGLPETGRPHHVHHKVPFRSFASAEIANSLDNLITLCPGCHRIAEMNVRIRSAISGLKYLLVNLAPLQVMCDDNDLGSYADPAADFTARKPVILIYDSVPAGIGLSKTLFTEHYQLLANAYDLITHCPCADGCPSCVGPVAENGAGGKKETLFLLDLLLKQESA